MCNLRFAVVAAILGAIASWSVSGLGAAKDKVDREAIRTLQRQLHSPTPSMRAQAVERLREFAALEVVKWIVPFALADPAEEVRRAAYGTLLAWKDDREIGLYLLKTFSRERRGRKGDLPVVAALLAVLVASDLDETRQELDKLLDGYAVNDPDGVLVITTVADELGKQGDAQSLTTLQRMTRLACFSRTFACRRAVVQAMILIRLPQSVEALIGLLSDVDGEVRGDILQYLGQISGEQHAGSSQAWEAWWNKHKDQFRFPTTDSAKPFAVAPQVEGPSYYGLPIQARRMVFVVDISGSMQGPRLAAAKRELINAIDGLPEDAEFTIVAFNSLVAVWKNGLMRATTAAKQHARQYVYGLLADGKTAASDALDAAFCFDAEAVYFLSDGEPNCGKLVDPVAIIAAVTKANRIRRISIHCIGILPGARGSALDLFMKTLAEQNFGRYCRVEP